MRLHSIAIFAALVYFKPIALRPAPPQDPRETMPSSPFPSPRGAPLGEDRSTSPMRT
ncbi:hypothetical protein CCUS01_12043 [Colletotrichum cuscutae]|uniref:Uncharacterized protein n=1 Tax=Colletotrichum cuscutae TaxID=1209917 RepID=A0AAI9U1P7_9PEZI|nr:hypothetical protein CCUS01_12043 [Colletotrichum cuscutae]